MTASREEIEERIKSDSFSKTLGVEFLEIKPGYARARMKVRSDMLNFHGVAHGGVIFTLADSVFAAASNAHGSRAVALSVNVVFRSPVFEGEELIAEANEISLGRTTAIYEMTVRKVETGKIVAVFQAVVYRTEDSIMQGIKKKH